MLHVLALGWPWFAAASALGSVVGFATTTPDSDREFSGRWVIALALALLGLLACVALVVSGPAGLLAKVGFLAGFAYLIGLPLGGVVKGEATPARPEPARPIPIVVRGGAARSEPSAPPPKREPTPPLPLTLTLPLLAGGDATVFEPSAPPPRPTITSSDTRPVETAPIPTEAVPAAPKRAAVAPKPAPSAAAAGGNPPQTLAAARGGLPDDLTKIKGVGPKSAEKLNKLGIYHYDQVASWNVEHARWIGSALGIPGRVERGKWVQQARELAERGAGRAH